MSGETKFSVMVSLFSWIQKSKSAQKKRSKFRKFLDTYCKPADYFDSIRLILPSLDRERGSYGLKEGVLATCLIDALGMSKESEDAQRLVNWRKGGAKAGVNAGNFALIASEVLQRRQGMISGGLTIKELNDYLDRLASSENRTEKTNVLSHLIKRTNAQEMKWIVMIILKDLKLGISEKSIFHEFHPDAEDLFNVTCDLKLVCEKLKDRNQRHKRQDIEVGKAVRPQLAMRVSNVAAAWKKLHGKEVVVECKFDGDRIQIHKNGNEIHFFSRNFLDHPEYSHGMSSIILSNILVDRCILDGEMLVWDASLNRFAEFGSNQEIAKAAKEGLDSDRQLCYVAFDILYDGDTSVIHQSLKERHELLRKVVKPIKGRFEILIPNGGLNAHRPPGEPCWSFVARHTDDVEKFFKETIENRDEGIVLKDLGSKWEPSDRSGKWLKLKPEYIRAGSDLDVLIIGGYYGSGRHGGEVAQFLVGLAKRSASATYPRRFISFCRVGTGLSDEELDTVVKKLKPYFRKYEYPKKASPSYYEVTNNSKERPDVWVESPEKSIIVSITSDIRTIKSEVFAAPYSLRFPRIHRVRYDKPWHECLDVESFVESVQSSNGTTQRGEDYGVQQDDTPKRSKSSRRGGKQGVSVVPSHFIQTDVSHIKGETLIFKNMMFYFANLPMTHSLDSLHKMVAENGGTFSMNLNSSVTHCVAAECRGIKFNAAKRHGDVIHVSWLFDCCSQKKLLPLQPKYFLVLSDSSKNKLQEEIDEYSDSYFWDVDIDDIRQLLSNINRSEDSKRVDYYKKKFCPKDKWSRFHGCCMYFHLPNNLLNLDWKAVMELAQRRMKLEVSFGGGNVSENLFHATHLVVMSLPGVAFDFDSLLSSSEAPVKRLLYKKQLHVVESRWLEDCFERDQRLQEEEYSLKPSGLDELTIEECKHSFDQKDESSLENVENSNLASSSDKDTKQRGRKTAFANQKITTSPMNVKRKRGRPASSRTNKGKSGPTQTPRRTRARIINKAPKICESESDINISSDEKIAEQEPEHGGSDHESLGEEVKQKGQLTNKGNTALKRPQRTKRRIASKPAKLHENESDSNTSLGDNDCIKQEADLEGSHKEGKQNPVVGESEPSIRDRTLERDTEYGKLGGWLDKSKGMASGSSTQGTTENLEIRVDPIQAMLLDMIPSLGLLTHTENSVNPILETKSTTRDRNYMVPRLGTEMSESADPLPKREMPTLDRTMIPNLGKMSESADPLPKREMSTQDVNPVPGKKKKVSYKDLAAELLRD